MGSFLPSYIFLDCNCVLHYKRADQIDWCALSNAAEVTLVITPVLLRELEQQKVLNPSKKLRHRANETIRWLSSRLDADTLEIRESVFLHFIDHEPSIDFEEHRLSERVADDQLIASAIEFSKSIKGQIAVATADLGLRVKLRSKGLRCIWLPEVGAEKLPEEQDSHERELLELRRENARLRSRTPQLLLRPQSAENNYPIVFAEMPDLRVPTLAQIKAQYPLDPVPHPERAWMTGWPVDIEEVQARNKQIEHFYFQWEQYIKETKEWVLLVRRSFEVELLVLNEGTAKATDIDIDLQFPDKVLAWRLDSLPTRPKQPEPPTYFAPHNEGPIECPQSPSLLSVFEPSLSIPEDRKRVTFHVSDLKHHHNCKLPAFLLTFVERDSVTTFGAPYRITCAEAPDRTEGTLVFNSPRQ